MVKNKGIMVKNIKQQMLDSIGVIYDSSRNCKLKNSFLEKVDNELCILSNYFMTTKIQAFFVAMVFALNYKGRPVDMTDLVEYFNCNPMTILNFSDDFDILHSKGILSKEKSIHRMRLAGLNEQFIVNAQITEAILQNKPMPKIETDNTDDILAILEKLHSLGKQRNVGMISTSELFRQAEEIISSNHHFPLIKLIDNFDYLSTENYLYLYLIWETLSGHESIDMNNAMRVIFDNVSRRVRFVQDFMAGKNDLIRDNLIELIEGGFLNDIEMSLTEKSINILKENGIQLNHGQKKRTNILEPSGIHPIELIFNNEEVHQLLLLEELLAPGKFDKTQRRLEHKGMPKGVTIVFHGAPGTGKTETVKQLAKKTNRDIMKVDISNSKSMWFGESEKKIKRIFSNYRAFAEECKQTPILFFNEADAVFSKRKEIGNSSVGQTENAIQNIILEELENFDGILIATTNMVDNFDNAFERRFLFKIEFHKPNTSTKGKIWKSKLPDLSDTECKTLADRFDFSGGQIENIVRKKEMHEIIYDNPVRFENILSFCGEELWNTKRVKIGFSKS